MRNVAHLTDTARRLGKIVSGNRPPSARRGVDPVETKGLVLFAPDAEPIERGGSFGSRDPHIGAADNAADRRQAIVGQHASCGRQRIRLKECLEQTVIELNIANTSPSPSLERPLEARPA